MKNLFPIDFPIFWLLISVYLIWVGYWGFTHNRRVRTPWELFSAWGANKLGIERKAMSDSINELLMYRVPVYEWPTRTRGKFYLMLGISLAIISIILIVIETNLLSIL